MNKISGIYKIQSKIKPERIYIGSAINIHARWIRHLWELKKGRHPSSKLQRHYNKYGKIDLVFSIAIGCSTDDLIGAEQFYIDSHETYFNTCKNAGSVLGRKMSNGTKLKIGQSNKGRQTALGRIMSEETKRKISAKLMGHKNNLGHICKEETKKKIADSHMGEKNYNYGKHVSEETRLRQSIGIKKAKGLKKLLSTINKN